MQQEIKIAFHHFFLEAVLRRDFLVDVFKAVFLEVVFLGGVFFVIFFVEESLEVEFILLELRVEREVEGVL